MIIGRNTDFFSFFGKCSSLVRGFKMNLLEKYSMDMFFKGMQENYHQQLFDLLKIIKTDLLVNFIDFGM